MPDYKLTYFDLRGLAEPSRLVFAAAGISFEDIRIPYTLDGVNEFPQEIKSKLPYRQVPLLEFGDKKLSQSLAIARFLARKFNLFGNDEFEAAQVEEIIEATRDFSVSFWNALRPFYKQNTEEALAARKRIEEEVAPISIGKFNEILKNGTGFLVGNQLSLADLYVYERVMASRDHGVDVVKNYGAIQEFLVRVENRPGIKEWLQRRPQTPF